MCTHMADHNFLSPLHEEWIIAKPHVLLSWENFDLWFHLQSKCLNEWMIWDFQIYSIWKTHDRWHMLISSIPVGYIISGFCASASGIRPHPHPPGHLGGCSETTGQPHWRHGSWISSWPGSHHPSTCWQHHSVKWPSGPKLGEWAWPSTWCLGSPFSFSNLPPSPVPLLLLRMSDWKPISAPALDSQEPLI
jgi:hypothetical protein